MEQYPTYGPGSSFQIKNQMPVDPEKVCYVYSALTTCKAEEIKRLAARTAALRDWAIIR
jgi:carboxypeptidase D